MTFVVNRMRVPIDDVAWDIGSAVQVPFIIMSRHSHLPPIILL
jgi:hypothetical protein